MVIFHSYVSLPEGNVMIVMWLHLFVTKEFRIQKKNKQQRVTLVKSDSLESRCRADA